MTPNDPRHGTNAGFLAHYRAKEPACEPCTKARARHNKRTVVRLARGERRRVPLGEQAWHIIATTTRTELSAATGIGPNVLSRHLRRGPDGMVMATTRRKILNAQPRTPVGVQRRVRALAALGYSASEISRRAGYTHRDALLWLMRRPDVPAFVRAAHVDALCRVYDELHMTPAPRSRSATRAIREAAARGWSAPLAWDEGTIDDPNATPHGSTNVDPALVDDAAVERTLAGDRVPLTRPERVEVIRRLASRGLSDAEMGELIGISGRTVQRIRTEFGIDTGWVAA